MKTIVYTYENTKPVFYELKRYYYLKNKAQLAKLIDKLLEIDAVFHPENLKFPVILELKAGFTPTLVKADLKAMKREQKTLKALRNRVK